MLWEIHIWGDPAGKGSLCRTLYKLYITKEREGMRGKGGRVSEFVYVKGRGSKGKKNEQKIENAE